MADPLNYLICDLEMTCSDDGTISKESQNMETIEIGAVMVSGTTHRIIGQFQSFVQPVLEPTLTAFATQLTTIQQSDVDHSPAFPRVWPAFKQWVHAFDAVCFCSWGGYDWTQLQLDCKLHGLEFFGDSVTPLNMARELKRRVGRTIGSSRAMKRFGIERTGTKHRGIDDALSYAKLLPHCLGWNA